MSFGIGDRCDCRIAARRSSVVGVTIPTVTPAQSSPLAPLQREAAPPRTVVLLLLFGTVTAVLFNDGIGGIAVTLVSLLLLATVSASVYQKRPAHLGLAAATVLTALVFSVRSSPWVLIPTALALTALLLTWVSLPRSVSVFDISWRTATGILRGSVAEASRAPLWAVGGAASMAQTGSRQKLLGWLRGVAIALPLLVGLFLLLASADPVFGSVVRPALSAEAATATLLTGVAATFAAVILTRLARRGGVVPAYRAASPRLGRHEAVVVLGSVATLFAAFVAVQLFTSRGGGLSQLQAEGITVAEYARSGYFQLLGVVFISAVVIMAIDGLRNSAAGTRASERALSVVIILLTLTILVVAMTRLSLYIDTFGLTMLRLSCIVAAIWMGTLLLILCAWVLGWGTNRNWLLGAIGLSLLVTTLGFAAVNPEARVAAFNIDRPSQQATDLTYLTTLSHDAVPTVLESIDSLEPQDAQALLQALCQRHDQDTPWRRWTLAQEAANASLQGRCLIESAPSEFRDREPAIFTGTVNV